MTIADVRLKGQLDADAATQAARVAYDQAYFSALLDAAKGSLDRSRSAAELVQKSAAAVGTIYAGILAVTFSASGRELPFRGIFPALFLGLAIVLAMIYVAYVTTPGKVKLTAIPMSPPERMKIRLLNFIQIVQEDVDRRKYSLRASVIALGIGVLFLTAAFISISPPTQPDLDKKYPWPTLHAVDSPQAATLAAIVLKAQVDEVAAARQRAIAGHNTTSDLGLWSVLTLIGLLLVFLGPKLTDMLTQWWARWWARFGRWRARFRAPSP